MKLINILLEYTDKQKQALGIPNGAVARGGVWYIGDKYAGQVVDGKFVKAVTQTGAPKQLPQPNSTPSTSKTGAPKQLPQPNSTPSTSKKGSSRKKVIDAMKTAGYKLLGKGTSAAAFTKTDDRAVKIIVPMKDAGEPDSWYDESKDHANRVFNTWHDYCKKNKDNPHLLKFFKKKQFNLGEESYLYVEMEKLKRCTDEQHSRVLAMYQALKSNKPLDKKYKLSDSETKFFNTLKDVLKETKRQGFNDDVVTYDNINVMSRGDDLVIIDPWT